jgi:hypothetical protein
MNGRCMSHLWPSTAQGTSSCVANRSVPRTERERESKVLYGSKILSYMAVCFTKARVTKPLNYSSRCIVIPEVSSCKYFGIILRSDLSFADKYNYAGNKARKALHFTMSLLQKGNSNTNILAYTS